MENMRPQNPYKKCRLCPRNCRVDRTAGEEGMCRSTDRISVARYSLHMWEEPCITGTRGSGTVFFTGCSLRCVYCQNGVISNCSSDFRDSRSVSTEELAEIFLKQQEAGAHNINLVTPDHFMPSVDEALALAKEKGLVLPVVCNCSGYETRENLLRYYRRVDVFLTDFKYMDHELARRLSAAADYPEVAAEAVDTMLEMAGEPEYYEDGGVRLLRKGVIVRHLVLPSHKKNSKDVLYFLYNRYGDRILFSIMNQYTPPKEFTAHGDYSEIARKLTKREYEAVVNYALELGITNAFIQEGETANESFIPDF